MIASFLTVPRLIAVGVVIAVIAGGVLYYGHTRYEAGKAKVQVELDAQRSAWQKKFDAQVSATAKIEEARDQLKWRIENELQPRLADATARGRTLAERLRDHQSAGRCPLSEAAGSSPEPDGSGRESGDRSGVDEALGLHLEACSRDAERLNGWREFYEGLRGVP